MGSSLCEQDKKKSSYTSAPCHMEMTFMSLAPELEWGKWILSQLSRRREFWLSTLCRVNQVHYYVHLYTIITRRWEPGWRCLFHKSTKEEISLLRSELFWWMCDTVDFVLHLLLLLLVLWQLKVDHNNIICMYIKDNLNAQYESTDG